VRRAEDPALGRSVAVKLLHPHLAAALYRPKVAPEQLNLEVPAA
jgi:hypothetical protein